MRKTLNPAQFLLIFAGGLFSILILIGIFNIAFDPYGEYNSGLFWSRVDQAGAIDGRGRSAKLILLNRLDAPPQVLIMGNSRAVALPGDVVEASTGLRTFNTATVNGSVYDLLAFTRYTLDQPDENLQAVILNVDPFLFQAEPDIELERFPLANYVPELEQNMVLLQVKRILRTISFDTTTASVRVFYRNYWQSNPVIYTYSTRSIWQADGSLYHLELDSMAEADNYPAPLESGLEYVKTRSVIDYSGDDPIPAAGRELFEKWLQLMQEKNICVTLFYPPYYSEVLKHVRANSDYEAHRSVLLDYIHEVQVQYDFRFFDLETTESFGGDDRWYVDGLHPLRGNTERIMQTLTADGVCDAG